MRAILLALVAALVAPASAWAVDWGKVIDESVRFYFLIDKAKELNVPVKELDMVQEDGALYWKGKFGYAKWETTGEVVYGTSMALGGVYLGVLSGEVNPKEWPEPAKSRFEKGVTTALGKLLSLQQEDGGWGWKVVLTEGKVRFPSGKGNVLRTSEILVRVLIPALRLNIRTVSYGGTTYDVAEHTRAAVRFLIDQQMEDGGYSANKEWSKTEDPLYTAWALKALCEAYRYRDLIGLDDATVEQLKDAIRKTVNWMLEHQEKSGDHAGLWRMESAAIMGSAYAPPSEIHMVMGLLMAYTLADELGLDKAKLADAINRALDAIVDWAADKYKEDALREFDGGKKMLGWAYSSTRLSGIGPFVSYTAYITAVLKLAKDLGLGADAIRKMESLGVTLQNNAEWVLSQWREFDGFGVFPYPNVKVFEAVTPSSQLYGLVMAVAFSHPEVFLKRTTADIWKLMPKTTMSETTSERKGFPVVPGLTALALALLVRGRR
ncbi:prenyltransferase/squalene oxidase repeat-containing protein [Methanopyrus sp.]